MIMKSLIQAVAIAAILAAPAVSFAQSNQPVTRAQVRTELIQLENAGYRATADHASYPDQIQAAEAKVAAENEQMAMTRPRTAGSSGVGGMMGGSSASGAATALTTPGVHSPYTGH